MAVVQKRDEPAAKSRALKRKSLHLKPHVLTNARDAAQALKMARVDTFLNTA